MNLLYELVNEAGTGNLNEMGARFELDDAAVNEVLGQGS